jgi:hypothetical protein
MRDKILSELKKSNRPLLILIEQTLVELYLHCTGRAGRYAQFARAALVCIKNDLHFRPLDVKGACRAYGSAGPALEAYLFIPLNILPNALHLDPDALQVINTPLKIFLVPAQFEHHKAFLSRINGRLEDIEGEIKLLDEIDGNGLVDDLFWKP